MKTIKIPADRLVKDAAGNMQTVRFADFVRVWLDDRAFGVSVTALRQALRLDAAFAGKKAGDVVRLEDADYMALRPVVEAPALGYGPIARHAFEMIDAVLSAKDVPLSVAEVG